MLEHGGVVWCCDDVDGRPDKVNGSVTALEMDRWKMVAATSEGASVRYGTMSRYVAGLGHPALDVRVWCDISLVSGPDIRHTFINGIGAATDVA